MADSDDDDAVGYGRPPKHSRFPKGRSGKPSGRPRGALNRASATIARVLDQREEVRKDGRVRRMSRRAISIEQLVNEAAAGDLAAIEQVLNLCAELEALKPLPAPIQQSIVVLRKIQVAPSGASGAGAAGAGGNQTMNEAHDER